MSHTWPFRGPLSTSQGVQGAGNPPASMSQGLLLRPAVLLRPAQLVRAPAASRRQHHAAAAAVARPGSAADSLHQQEKQRHKPQKQKQHKGGQHLHHSQADLQPEPPASSAHLTPLEPPALDELPLPQMQAWLAKHAPGESVLQELQLLLAQQEVLGALQGQPDMDEGASASSSGSSSAGASGSARDRDAAGGAAAASGVGPKQRALDEIHQAVNAYQRVVLGLEQGALELRRLALWLNRAALEVQRRSPGRRYGPIPQELLSMSVRLETTALGKRQAAAKLMADVEAAVSRLRTDR